jgi:hypothetical protein
LSGSYNTFSGSESTRITKIENNYATTGSNSFRADQSITGSLVVSSTITAQTLVVQTVTSSIVYSSGSNLFGSALTDRQTFTGSVNITGSLTVNTTGTEFQVTNAGVKIGNVISDLHTITGSMSVSGSVTTVGTITSYNTLQTFSNVSDATPAQLILSDTSNTRQLLIGYNSGSNYGSIQAIHQGVAYKNLVLNLSGGNVGIGNIGNSSYKLLVSGNNASVDSNGQNTIFLSAGTSVSFIDTSYIGGGSYVPMAFGVNGTEKMRISIAGSVGIGTTSPTASLTVVNSVAGIPSIPSLGSINAYTTAYFTNANPFYGLLVGSLNNGNSWMQVGRVDGSATAYDLQIQPRGGSVITGGSIVSSIGQFGSEKTVQINALNTSYLIFSGAPSGIVSARDNTNGGSGLWLLDPNGNGGTATLVAQNWINGVYTVFYSGGNTYVQKTSGNVPVIFHYAIYGN